MLKKKSMALKTICFALFFLTFAVSFGFAEGPVTVQDVVGTVQYYNPTTGEHGYVEKGQQLSAETFIFSDKGSNATLTDSSGAVVLLNSSTAAQVGGFMASGGNETATVELKDGQLVLQQGKGAPVTMPLSLAKNSPAMDLANAQTFGEADAPSEAGEESQDFTFDTPPSEGNQE